MKNPYKNENPKLDLTRLTCQVGTADWQKIERILPEHGRMDQLLSMLFHKFLEVTENERPKHYTLNGAETVGSLIERLTLTQTNGTHSGEANGRRTRSRNPSMPGAKG